MNFTYVKTPDLHVERRKEMMRKYPEQMRALMGPNPGTAVWVVGVVAFQLATAYFLRDLHWAIIIAAAYLIGAWANHALYVFIHESAHNLIFKSSVANRVMGMICDFPLLVPGAMAFRKYHLMHHTKMGQYAYDADLVSPLEAKMVGNCPIRKTLWVFLLGISQAIRPMRLGSQGFWDRWIVTNLVVQVLVTATLFTFVGLPGVVYLFASSIFGLGLHPLGARWIAEHFTTDKTQETYSYYGPMNPIMFNVGYHFEHHDLMTISWNRLPKVREVAPEFYRDLKSYPSYPKLLWQFLTDRELSLYSRILRNDSGNALTNGDEKTA